MAGQNRAIHGTWNTGIEIIPPMRCLTTTCNIGIEALSVQSRNIHTCWNVGVEILSVLARAIHVSWALGWGTLLNDPPEWKLVNIDLVEVLHILRGK